MIKIVCLGNEFVECDSFAKEVGVLLEGDFEVVNIKDSFQLMEVLNSEGELVLLDVVEGLDEVRELRVEDLRVDSIVSAHDFDVGQVLALFGHDSGEPGLLGVDVKIIGIPMKGDALMVRDEVVELLSSDKL